MDDISTEKPVKTKESNEIWMRGLKMIAFAFFFAIAETLLFASALVQFLWMLIKKEPNTAIASFGKGLGKWLQKVTKFQTGASEDLPFPWTNWE